MRASTGTEDRVQRLGVKVRSSVPPRRAVREGVKNLHGSKPIPKSLYKALLYHGNKDASLIKQSEYRLSEMSINGIEKSSAL
jgi:hypothetical protein